MYYKSTVRVTHISFPDYGDGKEEHVCLMYMLLL